MSDLFQKMQESSTRMINSLIDAAEHFPDNITEEQKELYQRILAKAERLKEKLVALKGPPIKTKQEL